VELVDIQLKGQDVDGRQFCEIDGAVAGSACRHCGQLVKAIYPKLSHGQREKLCTSVDIMRVLGSKNSLCISPGVGRVKGAALLLDLYLEMISSGLVG
jgi:hypothetical protein